MQNVEPVVEDQAVGKAKSRTRNIRLTIAYDGTAYVGWQIQPNGVSVQAVVQKAIKKLTGEDVSLLAAGRTDSGVHALGQVACFQTAAPIPASKFRDGIQSSLPDDVVIRESAEVAPDFHATYSAVRKHYRYLILQQSIANPFLRSFAWHHRGELDVEAMHDASQHLLGTHDFRAFESHFPNKATSVRTMLHASVFRQHEVPFVGLSDMPRRGFRMPAASTVQDTGGRFITLDLVADGFLYNMVRAIAGTLVRIGRGFWEPDMLKTIIDQQDRSQAGETAPACGLYMMSVDYGDAA